MNNYEVHIKGVPAPVHVEAEWDERHGLWTFDSDAAGRLANAWEQAPGRTGHWLDESEYVAAHVDERGEIELDMWTSINGDNNEYCLEDFPFRHATSPTPDVVVATGYVQPKIESVLGEITFVGGEKVSFDLQPQSSGRRDNVDAWLGAAVDPCERMQSALGGLWKGESHADLG